MNISSKYAIFLSVLLLQFIPISALAQASPSAHIYSIEDGLSDRQVQHIFQDSRGFLWIITKSSINRFDGKEFKVYTRANYGFRESSIFAMFEDKKGRIWLQQWEDADHPRNGGRWKVDVYDPKKQMAARLADVYDTPFSEYEIQWVGMDASYNVWIETAKNKLYKFNGEQFIVILENTGAKVSPNGYYENIALTNDGRMAIVENKELTVRDTLGNKLASYQLPKEMGRVYAGANDRIWLEEHFTTQKNHSDGDIYHLNRLWYQEGDYPVQHFFYNTGDPADYGRPWYAKYHTMEDKAGRLWVFQDNKLRLLGRSGELLIDDLFTNVKPENSKVSNFDIDFYSPFHIYFDHNNDAWLGTSNGVIQVSFQQNKFTNYLVSEDGVDSRGITEDLAGNIYALAGGVHKIDGKTGKEEKILDAGSVGAVLDKQGGLWFGGYLARVTHYDPTRNKYEVLQHPDFSPLGVPFAACFLFQENQAERIWVGTSGHGLAYIDPSKKELLLFEENNEFTRLSKSDVNAFCERKEGIYLSTDSGLYLLHPQKGVINHFGISTGDLPFENLLYLHIDTDTVFWLGSKGGGLIRWEKEMGIYQQFTTSEGLSDNVIYAVYEDDFGNLWLPSNNGLMQFNKKTFQVKTYTVQDGIPHREFNTGSHYKGKDGRLYFGGLGGVTSFHPKDFVEEEDTKILFSISITNFEKFDGNTGKIINKTNQIIKNKKILLKPEHKSFLLEFTLPNFRKGDTFRYAYKIEGWQEEWNFIQENFLRISGLPYGNYTLKIKAQNSKGNETKSDLTIPIFVEKPIYLKTWFLLIAGIGTIGLIGGFFKWRNFQLKQDRKRLEKEVLLRTQTILTQKTLLEEQNKQLENLNATKNRFFAIIAHDMRNAVYNFRGVTDKINYFIKNKQPQRIEEFGSQINTAVGNLTNLMNNLLDWALQQKNAFPYNPANIQLAKMADHIFISVWEQSEKKHVELSASIPDGLFVYADKNGLETILRNLITNAVKFTSAEDKVEICAVKKGDEVIIKISDTGTGMRKEQMDNLFQLNKQKTTRGTAGEKGSGLGLVLVKELLDMNKGTISIDSVEGKGTTIHITLPMGEMIVIANGQY